MGNMSDAGREMCDAAMKLYETSAKSKKFSGAVGIMGVLWAGAGGIAMFSGAAPLVEIALAAAAGANVVGATLGYAWANMAKKEGAKRLQDAVSIDGTDTVALAVSHSRKDLLAITEARMTMERMPTVAAPRRDPPATPVAKAAAPGVDHAANLRATLDMVSQLKQGQAAQEKKSAELVKESNRIQAPQAAEPAPVDLGSRRPAPTAPLGDGDKPTKAPNRGRLRG